MSDLTTYRLYDDDKDGDGELGDYLLVVPDTRLQAIADAWNYDDIGQGRYEFRQQWSELADLLDALGGTGKGAVTNRTQVQNSSTGLWTKRDTTTGRFTSVKRSGGTFKGVRKEK